MSARASMTDLITVLRGLTAAAASEYMVNSVGYWSDDQLQTVLDRHAWTVRQEELNPISHSGIGSVAYFDYQSPRRFWESTNGGTSRFVIQDQTGATIGTAAYSVDYPRGLVTFGTDTTGQTRYVTGYAYDMNAAAADVWGQKAAHYVTAYDVSTDNHNLRRSQVIDNCLKMQDKYASGATVEQVSVGRSDDVGE